MTNPIYEAKVNLIRSFIGALAIFIITFPCLRSRKSMWDAIAARKISYVLKCAVIIELFGLLPLFYCYIVFSPPVASSTYNFEHYWTFGFGRPVFGIIFISFGLFGEMHAFARLICASFCVLQGCFDAISSLKVYSHIHDVRTMNSPLGDYTMQTLHWYYWRDVGSFGMCIWILLLCLHLSNVVGWCQPPLITYQAVVGGDIDRASIFSRIRESRKVFDYRKKLLVEETKLKEKKALKYESIFDDEKSPLMIDSKI